MSSASNRPSRESYIEERLIRLRHEAFANVDMSAGGVGWPPIAPDLFGEVVGLPEVTSRELNAAVLRSGIVHHGALIVRNLTGPECARRLVDDIDRTFAASAAYHRGAPVADTTPWYVPFEPTIGAPIAPIRTMLGNRGGAVLAIESPRAATHVLDAFNEIGVIDSIVGHLGERPVLSGRKWTLRRVPADSNTSWHQDGAFLGHGIRTVNVWLALSPCGDDAPSLDVVPRRLNQILPTGTEGAHLPQTVGIPVVARAAEHAPILRPIFDAGDALLFDEMFLHRTGVGPQ